MNTTDLIVEESKTAPGIFCRKTYCDKNSPVLALVMGYGGSCRVWPRAFVGELAKKYVVITYDNRGTGLSVVPQDPSTYSIELMASDLQDVLNLFQVEAVNVFGYSMGGCIALQYAHDNAGSVKSLTLLSSTAGGALYVAPDRAMSAALANPPGKTLWDMYAATFRLMYSPAKFTEFEPVLREIYEESCTCATTAIALQGHSFAMRNFDGTSLLADLKMPVTVIAGQDDRLMPLGNAQNIVAGIPQSKLVLVPDCEHAAHIQNRESVIAEIEKISGI